MVQGCCHQKAEGSRQKAEIRIAHSAFESLRITLSSYLPIHPFNIPQSAFRIPQLWYHQLHLSVIYLQDRKCADGSSTFSKTLQAGDTLKILNL